MAKKKEIKPNHNYNDKVKIILDNKVVDCFYQGLAFLNGNDVVWFKSDKYFYVKLNELKYAL